MQEEVKIDPAERGAREAREAQGRPREIIQESVGKARSKYEKNEKIGWRRN